MEWQYPEEGQKWEEGEEIVAEFIMLLNLHGLENGDRAQRRLKRSIRAGVQGWRHGSFSFLRDEDIELVAYIPYTNPEPPEKPQDCPFCGSEMRHFHGDCPTVWHVYKCVGDCRWSGPPYKKTKAEAINALNSIKVVEK